MENCPLNRVELPVVNGAGHVKHRIGHPPVLCHEALRDLIDGGTLALLVRCSRQTHWQKGRGAPPQGLAMTHHEWRGRNLTIHSRGGTERVRFDDAAQVCNALAERFGIDLSDLGDVEARVAQVLDS